MALITQYTEHGVKMKMHAILRKTTGAEGGSRTRTSLRTTDFKSVSRVLTSLYCAIPSRIYRRFSRQSKLRLAWYEHVSPASSPHLANSQPGHSVDGVAPFCQGLLFFRSGS